MQPGRIRAGRVVLAAAAGALAPLVLAGTALAHAEIEVEPAQAGATDALVTVRPEAHHHDAGAVSVQVYPPEGISGADVTLVSGPAGWELTADADSYTVAGAELEIDAPPEHQVQVRRLPDAPVIHFRILVEYADGHVDRWIEIPTEDDPEPPAAAPGVELAAAPPSTTAPVTTPPPAPTSPPDAATADAGEASGDGRTGVVVAVVAAVLLATGAGTALALRARRRAG